MCVGKCDCSCKGEPGARGVQGVPGPMGPVGPSANGLYTFEVIIPSAQVLTAFTSPVLVIDPPGVGLEIEVISSSCKVVFNSIAYATHIIGILLTDTAINSTGCQMVFDNALNATVTRTWHGRVNFFAGPASNQQMLIENKGIYFSTTVGDPTAGDSDLVISGLYRIKNS